MIATTGTSLTTLVSETKGPLSLAVEVNIDSHMTPLAYLTTRLEPKDFHGLYANKASHFYQVYQDCENFSSMKKVFVVVAWAQTPSDAGYSIPVGIAMLDERANKGKLAFGVVGVYIAPFLRGKGLGTQMLKQLMGSHSHKYPLRILAEGRKSVVATGLRNAGYVTSPSYRTVSQNYVQMKGRFSSLTDFQKS